MSRETLEFVRSFYPDGRLDWAEVFSSVQREREFAAWFDPLAHPEYRMVWVSHDQKGRPSPASTDVAGHMGALRARMRDYERYEFVPELFVDLGGDHVLVLERLRMRQVGDAIETESEPATIYEIIDGKLRTAAFYRERSDALAAAGLSEDEARRQGVTP